MAGPILPPTIDNSGWLKYYSHVFDYVEIDSSFYRIPSPIHGQELVQEESSQFQIHS